MRNDEWVLITPLDGGRGDALRGSRRLNQVALVLRWPAWIAEHPTWAHPAWLSCASIGIVGKERIMSDRATRARFVAFA